MTDPKCIQKAKKILQEEGLRFWVGGVWIETIGSILLGYIYWGKLTESQEKLLTKLVKSYSPENTELLKRMIKKIGDLEPGWAKGTLFDLTKTLKDLGRLSDKQKALAEDIINENMSKK